MLEAESLVAIPGSPAQPSPAGDSEMSDHRVGSRSPSRASAADVDMLSPVAEDAAEAAPEDEVFEPDFGGPDEEASGDQAPIDEASGL